MYWTLAYFNFYSYQISISAFDSLVGMLIGITNSAIGLKICVINAGIKNFKSINKVLISKPLMDSNISHDKFVIMLWKNSMIWEKKSKILMINKLYKNQCCVIAWSVQKSRK